MADYKPITLIFNNRGVDIRTIADQIAIDEYATLTNVVSLQEGAVSTRLGSTALNTTVLSDTAVHTLTRLSNTRYVGASTKLFAAFNPFLSYAQITPGNTWAVSTAYQLSDLVKPTASNGHWYICTTVGTSNATTEPTWPTGVGATVTDGTVVWTEYNMSGNGLLPVEYAIGTGAQTWKIFPDTKGIYKDSGNGQPVRFGLVAPVDAPTVTADALAATGIENFDEGDPNAYWSKIDTGAILTLSRETTIKKEGQASLKVVASAAGQAFFYVSKTVDLSYVGGSLATDSDNIHIFIYATAPQNISEMLLQLSIGDTSFAERYEKAVAPTAFAQGLNFATETHQAARPLGFQDNVFNDATDDTFPADVPYRPATMEDGANVWTELLVPRSEFFKAASTDTTYGWADVKAIRIGLKLTGACTFYFDDWTLVGGGELSGSDLLWKYVYRVSATGTRSNPSPESAELTTTAAPDRQSVTVLVRNSNDPQIDKIDIYRLGGSAETYRLSGTIANNPNAAGAYAPYADNVLDAELTDDIETDNDLPALARGGVIHNESLFTWGTLTDAPNIVRFTKRVNIEQQPSAYTLNVGTGADKIVTLIEDGGRLVAVTRRTFYQIVGTDPTSYVPLETGYRRGMVDNPEDYAVAPGRIYHRDYDGIYEYPGGKKISQMIDGVFHGQTINGISPVNPTAVAEERMAFFDNKLYFAYPSGSSNFNDAVMIYDVLYDRWWPCDLPLRAMYWEQESSILTAAKFDGYVYQLETGITDNGSAIAFELQTKYIDVGLPDQDKIWGDMTLDLDTGGSDVSVLLAFDNGDTLETAVTVNQDGRGLVQIPINDGDSIEALNCQIRISGSVSTAVVLYKAILRIIVEPPKRRTYVTDWSNSGSPLRKRFTTLVLELDTLDGLGVDVELQLDGATTATQTFSSVITDGRQVVYLGVNEDTVGTTWRLKFTQVSDSLRSVLKLYDFKIDFLPQPMAPDVVQSEWTDKGSAYEKYWKEVLIDIDTFGASRTVEFQLDGETAQSFTVTADGRRSLVQSLDADLIGNLGRVIITGGDTALYTVDYVTQAEPADVTRADSLEQTFGFDREKIVKRLWIAYKAPADITLNVYADEVLVATKTIPASALPTGWEKIPVRMPPNKGKLYRFIFTSSSAFKIYFEQSEVELKPLNVERGYARYKFRPPQTM